LGELLPEIDVEADTMDARQTFDSGCIPEIAKLPYARSGTRQYSIAVADASEFWQFKKKR
jgi:hypothetical protein